MISIYLGNVGSGKTACAVRAMVRDPRKVNTFSNIQMQRPELFPHIHLLDREMIITHKVKSEKKDKKTGEMVQVLEKTLNMDFWKAQPKPTTVILDEAHSILNARRALSSINVVVSDWLALIRRVLGGVDSDSGELILISQLHNRLDPIARDMANLVKYHICHYIKACLRCGFAWRESSETSVFETHPGCIRCGHPGVKKHGFQVQVMVFKDIQDYLCWKLDGQQTVSAMYMVHDIEQYFQYYDTYQWENMFGEY